MNLLLPTIGFGIVTASILALAAVGFTLQFSVTGVVNFAFGDLMTVAAYIAWLLNAGLHVNSFAQGKKAIQSGESVYYYGATGLISFNKYHNASGNFAATAFNADGSCRQLGTLPAARHAPGSSARSRRRCCRSSSAEPRVRRQDDGGGTPAGAAPISTWPSPSLRGHD